MCKECVTYLVGMRDRRRCFTTFLHVIKCVKIAKNAKNEGCSNFDATLVNGYYFFKGLDYFHDFFARFQFYTLLNVSRMCKECAVGSNYTF